LFLLIRRLNATGKASRSLEDLLELRAAGRDQEMLGEVTRIPVSNYTDAEILEQEMNTVFRS
jgi:hypothetical protein